MSSKRWWLIAIIAMVIINGILWLWLGPKGGSGLFLFVPLVFAFRGSKRHEN